MSDYACTSDFEPEMRVISDEPTLVAHALVRRWQTPRGMLLDDEDYGTDLTEYIGEDVDALTLVRIRSETIQEARKETERVADARVLAASFDRTTGAVAMTIAIDLVVGGTSILNVTVSELTVDLLTVEVA